MTPEALIAALSAPQTGVPHALLQQALEQRAAVTEPLLQALTAWTDKTEQAGSQWDDGDWLSDFALYLLAQFREPRAFPLYLRLCRLPEDQNDLWLGDVLTHDMPAFLASTCAGNVVALQDLMLDPGVYEWSRWAATSALVTLAVQGEMPVERLVDWLLQVADTQQRGIGNIFWSMAASAQYDLAEPALMPMLERAYAEDLVDVSMVGLPDLRRRLQLDPARRSDQARQQNDYLRDAGRAMHWLIEARNRPADPSNEGDDGAEDDDGHEAFAPEPYVRATPKIGRNEPCHCGSGKKYKKCCLDAETFRNG
jgi:hypothetical protein